MGSEMCIRDRSQTAIALSHLDNYEYAGPKSGDRATLEIELSDPSNWNGSNSVLFTPPGAFSVSSSPCASVSPGDIQFVTVNTDNPDLVALVSLTDLPGGLELRLTDNAWTSSGAFLANEGVLALTLPNAMPAGTIFGYSSEAASGDLLHATDWVAVSGNFALSASGDNIFVYCETDDGVVRPVGGISTKGDWVVDAGTTLNTGSSFLPAALSQSGIALSHLDNYEYAGPTTGSKAEMQLVLSDAANWSGSNTIAFTPPAASFTISD